MMLSLTLSRFLGLFKTLVIGWQFGQTELTSAYSLSFQIPDLVFFLLAGGALSSAFIPVFSEYLHTGRREEAWHVFSSVTTIVAGVLIVVIAGLWVFAHPLVYVIAPGVTPEQAPIVAELSRIILPAQFAFLVGGLMFGTLYARQAFLAPAMGPNIYNLGIIGGAVALAPLVTPGVAGMSWGALVGAVVGNFLIPLWAMWRLKSSYRLVFDFRHPGVVKVFKLMAPVVLGLSLPGLFALLLRSFATMYPSLPGLPNAIDQANQFQQAPLGVFGQSLALAAFPALSQFFAQGTMDLFREQLGRTLRTTVYLATPAAGVLVAAPEFVIRALMEHGAFTAENTEVTAWLLRGFGLGVVAWCMHPVLMRAYFAVQRTVPPVVQGTCATALFVGLGLAAIGLGLPYWALPLAGSVTAIALIGFMLFAVRKQVGEYGLRGLLTTIGKSLAATTVSGLALWAGLAALPTSEALGGKLALLVALGLGCLLYAWLYYGLTRWMKMPETETLSRAMGRLNRRS